MRETRLPKHDECDVAEPTASISAIVRMAELTAKTVLTKAEQIRSFVVGDGIVLQMVEDHNLEGEEWAFPERVSWLREALQRTEAMLRDALAALTEE